MRQANAEKKHIVGCRCARTRARSRSDDLVHQRSGQNHTGASGQVVVTANVGRSVSVTFAYCQVAFGIVAGQQFHYTSQTETYFIIHQLK